MSYEILTKEVRDANFKRIRDRLIDADCLTPHSYLALHHSHEASDDAIDKLRAQLVKSTLEREEWKLSKQDHCDYMDGIKTSLENAGIPVHGLLAVMVQRTIDKLAAVTRELEEARGVCGEAYQLAGAVGASVAVLDNLSAVAHRKPIPHKTFLPILDTDCVVVSELQSALAASEAAREKAGEQIQEYRRGTENMGKAFEDTLAELCEIQSAVLGRDVMQVEQPVTEEKLEAAALEALETAKSLRSRLSSAELALAGAREALGKWPHNTQCTNNMLRGLSCNCEVQIATAAIAAFPAPGPLEKAIRGLILTFTTNDYDDGDIDSITRNLRQEAIDAVISAARDAWKQPTEPAK